MKRFPFLLPLLLALLALDDARTGRQYIQCSPWDTQATERVVISLKPSETGTLYLVTDVEQGDHSGLIPLARDRQSTEAGQFVFRGENEFSHFSVMLPANAFWRRSDDFSVELQMKRKDGTYVFADDLRCYSRIYEQ